MYHIIMTYDNKLPVFWENNAKNIVNTNLHFMKDSQNEQ